jgi:hypothetical protein
LPGSHFISFSLPVNYVNIIKRMEATVNKIKSDCNLHGDELVVIQIAGVGVVAE